MLYQTDIIIGFMQLCRPTTSINEVYCRETEMLADAAGSLTITFRLLKPVKLAILITK